MRSLSLILAICFGFSFADGSAGMPSDEPKQAVDTDPPKVVKIEIRTTQVLAVAISPEGSRLAVGSVDGGLWIYEALTGKLLRTLRSEPAPLKPGQELLPFNAPEFRKDAGKYWPVTAVAFDRDGATVAAATYAGTWEPPFDSNPGRLQAFPTQMELEVWRIFDSRQIATIKAPAEESVQALAFEPDGKHICSIDSKRRFSTWRIETARRVADFGGRVQSALVGAPTRVETVFDREAGRAASIMADEGDGEAPPIPSLTLWERDARRQHAFAPRDLPGVKSLDSVALSPDGRLIALLSNNTTIHLIDFDSAFPTRRVVFDEGFGEAFLAFGPDGSRVVAIGSEGKVGIVTISGAAPPWVSRGVLGVVRGAVWLDDRVLVVSEDVVRPSPNNDPSASSPPKSLSVWTIALPRP